MNNEEKINFLKENYDVIAKKITHYDAAFRILENLVDNKVEHIDKLEQIENKTQETFEGIMKAVHLMSIDVGCVFLVVIDLPQENIQSLILSPLANKVILI